jgi:hypothetical protein
MSERHNKLVSLSIASLTAIIFTAHSLYDSYRTYTVPHKQNITLPYILEKTTKGYVIHQGPHFIAHDKNNDGILDKISIRTFHARGNKRSFEVWDDIDSLSEKGLHYNFIYSTLRNLRKKQNFEDRSKGVAAWFTINGTLPAQVLEENNGYEGNH